MNAPKFFLNIAGFIIVYVVAGYIFIWLSVETPSIEMRVKDIYTDAEHPQAHNHFSDRHFGVCGGVKVGFEAGIKQKQKQQQKLISNLDQRSLQTGMESKIQLL